MIVYYTLAGELTGGVTP